MDDLIALTLAALPVSYAGIAAIALGLGTLAHQWRRRAVPDEGRAVRANDYTLELEDGGRALVRIAGE